LRKIARIGGAFGAPWFGAALAVLPATRLLIETDPRRLIVLISSQSPRQKLLHLAEIAVRIVHVLFLPGFFDGLYLLIGQMPLERRVVIRVFESGQLNVHFATGAFPPAFLQQIEFDLAVRKLSRASHIIKRIERHAHLVDESALLLQPPIR